MHRDDAAKTQIPARLSPAGAKTGSGFLLSQISPRICRRIFLLLIKSPLLFISLSVLYMVPQLTLVLCVCLYYGCTLFPCQENSQAIPLTKYRKETFSYIQYSLQWKETINNVKSSCIVYCIKSFHMLQPVFWNRIRTYSDLFGRIRIRMFGTVSGSGSAYEATKLLLLNTFFPFCNEKLYEFIKTHVCYLLFHK
jgi:hypothetical protein